MILPIVAYGNPVLKKKAKNITQDYPELDQFIYNMWETMYKASGVGLAAPQVGVGIRLFVVDASPFAEDEELSQEEKEQLNEGGKQSVNEAKGYHPADQSKTLRFLGFKKCIPFDSAAYSLLEDEIASVFDRKDVFTPGDFKNSF